MQDAHGSLDHHPPRLIGLAAAAAALLAAAQVAHAAKPRFWSLPSPFAPLSLSPPIGGGAHSATEGRPHRVFATTQVRIQVDGSGTPFAVAANQSLDVRGIGDYSFQIGAPVVDARAAPGSAREPGVRRSAYLWEGFNPGVRILAAHVQLKPRAAAASLPLRLEVSGERLTLRNATAIAVSTFAADALAPPLRSYLASLRRSAERDVLSTGGSARVTSPLERRSVQVSAPLHVTGTVGTRRVDVLLGGAAQPLSATFARGRVRLKVAAEPPLELLSPGPGETGRALLARATRASLELARVRQYDTFLGNPDASGPSSTTYVYVSGRRTLAPKAAATQGAARNWWRVALIAIAGLAAAALAAAAWTRS